MHAPVAGASYVGAVAHAADAGAGGGPGERRVEGFDAFFHRLYPAAQVVALRLTGSVRSAEASAIEAFTDALLRWRRVSTMPHRDAWVMRRVVDDAIGRARRDPIAARPEDEEPELRQAVVVALARLPRRQRESILLAHLARLPVPQVAAALGTSPGEVRADVQAGVAGLRTMLDGPRPPS